jgi:predicted PurR-regulated permease PerM
VGLFLGPIILSVLLAVWQAWLRQLNTNQLKTSLHQDKPD